MERTPMTTGTTRTGPDESGFDHRALDRATAMSRFYGGGEYDEYNSAVAGVSDDHQGTGRVDESGFDHRAVRAARRMAPDADNGGVNGAMGGLCSDC